MWEVKDILKLHNLHIEHVTILSEPKNFVGAKVVGTVKSNHCPVWVPWRFLSHTGASGSVPTLTVARQPGTVANTT